MGWNKNLPASSSNIIDIPIIFSDNWLAIQVIFGIEHYSLTVPLSGKHQPGKTGIIYSGTTSAISAISSPESGALAWDTTLGVTKRYTGSTWEIVENFNTTRIQAYRTGDTTIAASSASAVPYNSETKDELSEWDSASYIFTAKSAGTYWIRADVLVTPDSGGNLIQLAIQHLDVSSTLKYQIESRVYSLSTDDLSIREAAILTIATGEKIRFNIEHDGTDTMTIKGGSTNTFMSIHRMS